MPIFSALRQIHCSCLCDGPSQLALRNPTRMLDAPIGSLVVWGGGQCCCWRGGLWTKGTPQADPESSSPLAGFRFSPQ